MNATTKQARNSHFQRGSGVYTCRCCGHNTRSTGGDGAGVKLCDICYELAGEENSLSDSGELYCPGSTREMLALLDTRMGNGTAKRLFPEVFAAAFPEEAQVWIVHVVEAGADVAKVIAHKSTEHEARARAFMLHGGAYDGPYLASRFPVGAMVTASELES